MERTYPFHQAMFHQNPSLGLIETGSPVFIVLFVFL